MKNTLYFDTQAELEAYFGGVDKIPSKILALVKDVPYTSSAQGPKLTDVLYSSTNNVNTPSQGNTPRPSGTSAVSTATTQAQEIEVQDTELDAVDAIASLICFGETENISD